MKANKNIIKINESQLRDIISESIKNILRETSSDLAHAAMTQALNRRNNAIGTPEYGRRDKQAQNFAGHYQERFNKENQQHNSSVNGSSGALTFDDVLNNGVKAHFTFTSGGLGVTFDGDSQMKFIGWEDLRDNRGRWQERICQLSDNNAQMVAKWWKQNHGWRNTVGDEGGQKWGGAGYNPEFWTRYREDKLNNTRRGF